jgi:hypothetical protein
VVEGVMERYTDSIDVDVAQIALRYADTVEYGNERWTLGGIALKDIGALAAELPDGYAVSVSVRSYELGEPWTAAVRLYWVGTEQTSL